MFNVVNLYDSAHQPRDKDVVIVTVKKFFLLTYSICIITINNSHYIELIH